MAQAIQTRLKLQFTKAGSDVSESLLPDLLSFSYTDKETNEADAISVTLKDSTGKWAGTWKPNGGEVVAATIIKGTIDEKLQSLYCGKFYIDRQSVAGNPRTYSFEGVSIPLDKPIRKKIENRAWEKKSLKEIATEIAIENVLSLVWDCEGDEEYDRIEQKRESDMAFLLRLCEEVGFSLKVTDDKIVIFDQLYYEMKAPVKTFTLGKSDILSWNFESNQSEKYKSVTIAYRDPKKKRRGFAGSQAIEGGKTSTGKNPAVIEYTYTDPDADPNGQEFAYKTRAKTLQEAERKAKAKLRQLNRRAVTGGLTIIGDTSMVAGVVVRCIGFGSFDGNFIVEEAEHSIGSGGYTTSITLRRVNKGF